ncbi:MAG: CHAT domain-containing tetratricopeptide repeat protein [Bacteroidota bacterium]
MQDESIKSALYLIIVLWGLAGVTLLKAQTSAFIEYGDPYNAYKFSNAQDKAMSTQYDTANVILLELMAVARDSQPAAYLEIGQALIENLIVTRQPQNAWSALRHFHAYWRQRKRDLRRPQAHLSDLYCRYGEIAFTYKSKALRRQAREFFDLALQLVPGDAERSGILERKIGMAHRLLGENDRVLPAYDRSLRHLTGQNCRERLRTLQEIGVYHYRQLDSLASRTYLERARAIMNRCRQVRPDDKIVQLYYEGKLEKDLRDNAESAERIFREASAISRAYDCQTPLLPYVYSALGTVQLDRGFHEDARVTFTDYLNYHVRVTQDSLRIGMAYLYLGKCLTALGDHDAALQYYDEAFAIVKGFGPDRTALADLYQNYGSVLLDLARYDEALNYLDSALTRYLDYFPEDHNRIGKIYYSIGLCYDRKALPERAEAHYEWAIASFRQAPVPAWGNIAHTHTLIANTRSRRGQVLAAQREIARAQEALARTDPYDIVNIAESLLETAFFEYSRQNHDEALRLYQRTLNVVVSGYQERDPTGFPKLENTIAHLQALEALRGKAQSFRARYRLSADPADLRLSLRAYEHTIELIREVRQDHREEGSKLFLSQTRRPTFEAAIEVAWQLYRLTGAPEYQAKAFDFSEQSKAMILLEAVSSNNAEQIAGIPPEMLRRKRRILDQMDLLNERLRTTNDPAKSSEFRSQLFDLRNAHTAILDTFASDFPKYFDLVYGFQTAQPDQVQARMQRDNCSLVEYFTGDSALYTFAFAADTFVVQRTRLNRIFLDSLESLRRFLIEPGPSNASAVNYAHNARMVYDTLLGSLPIALREKVVIVPDGPLNYLSFDALVTAVPDLPDPKFNELRYFLDQHVTSYNYSATFLLRPPRPVLDRRPARILALAPSFASESGLPELAGARENVAQLARRYRDVVALMDGAASKPAFESQAAEYDILDLATHGSVDTLNPMDSRLYFAPDGTGDSILYLDELYTMQLQARLAILEACETGAGALQMGEGVMSMARGFTYAGCDGVVMSLWQAADAASSAIIALFYAELAAGKSVDAALTQAKRNFLAEMRQKGGLAMQNLHPFFWSGLVIIGDTQPMPFATIAERKWQSSLQWALPLGLVLLLGGWGWVKWQRGRRGA